MSLTDSREAVEFERVLQGDEVDTAVMCSLVDFPTHQSIPRSEW